MIRRADPSNAADRASPDRFLPSPQNLIFRFLQTKARIQIWLYENTDTVVEGRIIVSTRPRVSYLPTRASEGSPPDEPIDHIFRVNGSQSPGLRGRLVFFGFFGFSPASRVANLGRPRPPRRRVSTST